MPIDKNLSTIAPCLSYRDAPAAIDWLCRAFGFEKHLVVPNEQGGIAHAELVFGNGMLMLGTRLDDDNSPYQKTPRQVGGTGTVSICVIVADADRHHQRAVAAGAEIIAPLEDKHYGGRGYVCRDLEGHLWAFGTYNPWAPTK